ncbi:cyclase family protein [bacterium]|nr:cyclase family protein [bacterium]
MAIVDLSGSIEPNAEIELNYYDHSTGARQISDMFNIPPALLKDGEGWTVEEFTRFHTHSCTHVDAPWHYNSRIAGKPAPTIDELPLEWFFANGVVLEMRHKGQGDAVTIADIEKELSRIQYRLTPLDIVLVRNGQDQYFTAADYMHRGCGVTADATRWLYDKGIRVMGIDCWGWDRPLYLQAEKALESNQKGVFWEAHQADIAYCQIERMVNLDALPAKGFKVACFPLKIKRASGAPARVVAMLPD